jgi:chromosome partitioning protein
MGKIKIIHRKREVGMDNREIPKESASNRPSGTLSDQAGHSAMPPKRDSYVIAIANQKGGVAKTTSVVSLGGALVWNDKEVLLVDLDAQSNLTLALGKDPTRVRGSITDVLFNSATLLSVSRETAIPGLDLVPSNAGMELAERFLPVRKDYETILSRALNDALKRNSQSLLKVAQEFSSTGNGSGLFESDQEIAPPALTESRISSASYDFVLLDCPPFMGAITLNALIAADMLIVPTQPEYFSAHALNTMMATVRQVRSQYNPNLVYRILITMFDQRNRIHREVRQQIRDTFGGGTFETEIGIDTKLRESAVEGIPITHYRSRSRSAQQYDALAQELIQYVR